MSFLKKITKSRIIRNVIIVASGTATAQIIAFLLTPIITRIYGPEAYGTLGTFMAIISILGPIAALTYPIAMVLPKKDSTAKQIVKLSFLICLGFGLLTALLLIFAFDYIVGFFNLYTVADFLFLIPVIVVLSGTLQIMQQWLIRTKQFSVTAKVTVIQSILVNTSMIGMGLLYPFSVTLVLIKTIGVGLKSTLMLIFSDKSILKKEDIKEEKDLKETAKYYKDFPLYRSPQVFLNAVSTGLPTLLLASFFGPGIAGFYSLTKQALATPVQLLGKAVQDVFYPRLSEAANRKEGITKLIIISIIGLIAVGIIPFSIIIYFGPEIFTFIFGEEWTKAGIYAQWLGSLSFFLLITRPIVVTIPVLQIQKQFLIFESFGTVIKIGALILGLYYFNDIYAVALFSLAGVGLYIILTLYTLNSAKKFDIANTFNI